MHSKCIPSCIIHRGDQRVVRGTLFCFVLGCIMDTVVGEDVIFKMQVPPHISRALGHRGSKGTVRDAAGEQATLHAPGILCGIVLICMAQTPYSQNFAMGISRFFTNCTTRT